LSWYRHAQNEGKLTLTTELLNLTPRSFCTPELVYSGVVLEVVTLTTEMLLAAHFADRDKVDIGMQGHVNLKEVACQTLTISTVRGAAQGVIINSRN
jgi:hypothetical protein